jgi:transcriptional regulator with XRE-family HTH domain
MKQTKVARQHGINEGTFSLVLNGHINPQRLVVRNAMKVAKALNITVDELISLNPAQLKTRYFKIHELGETDGKA